MGCKGVLVVEDDADIGETIVELLRDEGYHVMWTHNGKEALDLLQQLERPCIVLLDLMMPVMDGITFLHERQKNVTLATIPVVAMSSVADKATMVEARLRKPFNIGELLAVVQEYCGPP